jgi:hypothetical protein
MNKKGMTTQAIPFFLPFSSQNIYLPIPKSWDIQE